MSPARGCGSRVGLQRSLRNAGGCSRCGNPIGVGQLCDVVRSPEEPRIDLRQVCGFGCGHPHAARNSTSPTYNNTRTGTKDDVEFRAASGVTAPEAADLPEVDAGLLGDRTTSQSWPTPIGLPQRLQPPAFRSERCRPTREQRFVPATCGRPAASAGTRSPRSAKWRRITGPSRRLDRRRWSR